MSQRLIPAYARSFQPSVQLLPTQSYREYQTMSDNSTIDITRDSVHYIAIDPVPAHITVQVDTSNFELGNGLVSIRGVGGTADGQITVQFMMGSTAATAIDLSVRAGITTIFAMGYHVNPDHSIVLDLLSVADQPEQQVPTDNGSSLNPSVTNGNFSNGVLHWTGGTITTPLGDVNGVMMTVPASTSITLSDTSCAVAGQQNLFVIWSTLADAVAALAAMLQNQQGLYITYAQNDKHVAVDGITRYAFAATIEQTFTASGQHIHYDYGVGQGNTPDTTQPAPTYMHVIVVDPTGGTVPDATLGLA